MNLVFAKTKDFEKILPLYQKCLDELGSATTVEEIKTEYEAVLKVGVIIFIEEDGEILGFLNGRVFTNFLDRTKQARDSYWYVKKEHRKKGVGVLILKAFEAWAKANGCSTMVITPSKFGGNNPEKVKEILEIKGYHLHGYQMRRSI